MMPILMLAEGDNPLEHVVDKAIVVTGDGWWLVSNHTVMLVVAALIVLAVFIPVTAKYRGGHTVPGARANFLESIMLYLRDVVAKPLLGEYTDFYMPLLWTIFFFVWTCNLLGLVPLEPLTGGLLGLNHGHGIGGTATANIVVTGCLALVTFVVVQLTGIIRLGFGTYLKHFLGGAPAWLAPIMLPVEFLGMLVKPFALMIRLFANMTAGHVLLAVLIGFTGMIGIAFNTYWASVGLSLAVIPACAALMLLELFVATLQAYIFMFLTALFISQMLPHDHHDDDEHHGHVGDHHHAQDTVAASIANTPNQVAQPTAQRASGSH